MKNLLINFLLILFVFTYSYANIDDKINKDLDKSFKKYEKEIEKLQKKISSLKKNESEDAQRIDQSLKKLVILVEFSKQNLSLDKQDVLLDSLNLIDLYIKDISKIIPKEITRKVSDNENESMSEETLNVMVQLSSSSKAKKQKTNIKIQSSVESLESMGVDINSINQVLTN